MSLTVNQQTRTLEERIAALEAKANPEPTPGFFNAENMDYLHKMAHEQKRQIERLQEEVSELRQRIDRIERDRRR